MNADELQMNDWWRGFTCPLSRVSGQAVWQVGLTDQPDWLVLPDTLFSPSTAMICILIGGAKSL